MTKATSASKLAFQKFAARNATTNEVINFVLRPITIPLPRMSRVQILNLFKGNNLPDRELLKRRSSTTVNGKAPFVARKASKVVKPKKQRAKPKPKPAKPKPAKPKPAKPSLQMPGLIQIAAPRASTSGTTYNTRVTPRQRSRSRPEPEMPILERMLPFQIKQEPFEMTVPVNPISLLNNADMEGSTPTRPTNRASDGNQIAHSIFGSDHQCPICNEIFMQYDDFLIHRRSHRYNYTCELCPKYFDNESLLRIHVKTHYNVKKSSNQGKLILGQRVLKKRGLPLTKSLFLSLDTPASPHFDFETYTPLTLADLAVPFACDSCGESFANKDSLKQHYLSHFGLVPTKRPAASMAEAQSPIMAQDQAQSSSSHGPPQPLEPIVVSADGSIVPYKGHVSSFEAPPTPSPSSSSSQSYGVIKKEILSYEDTLIQAERIKKFAFTNNDAFLLNKMLEIESHVTGKIIAARVLQLSSPSQESSSP